MTAFQPAAWLELLWRATWQGGLFLAAVWVLCRVLPRVPAHWKCWLWWLACLRLLVGLLDLPPLSLPLLDPEPAPQVMPVLSAPATGYAISADPAPVTAAAPRGLEPSHLLLALWAIGVLVRVGATTRTLLRIQRLRRAARPVEAPDLQAEVARLASEAGVRTPPVLVSSAARAPMLVGPLAPALLLPAEALEAYEADELRMALVHELVHLRRGDLWLSVVPGLAQVLFFFHPLAWLGAREWAVAREAACDAETLTLTAAQPADYGRLLLRLAASGPAPAGVLSATPTYRTLERRLKMLGDTASNPSSSARARRFRRAGAVLSALLAVGLLPWRVTAKDAPVATAPPSGASDRGVAPTPDSKPGPKAAHAERPAEKAVVGLDDATLSRILALERQLAAEREARLKSLQSAPVPKNLKEQQRLLREWDRQDLIDMRTGLHRFEQELKAMAKASIAQGADPVAIHRLNSRTLHLVEKLLKESASSAGRNRRALVELLLKTPRETGPAGIELDPDTGEVRVPRDGAKITGRLPALVPSRTPVAGALKEVSIRGNTAIPLAELLKVTKTRSGEPFSKSRWDDDLLAVSRRYQDQGYMARFDIEGPKDGKVALVIHELAIGEVRFKWATPDAETHLKAVQKALTLKAGGLYNTKTLQNDYLALSALKLFETISPIVEVAEDGKVSL
ncbi:MAG: peptidase family protein, partial [Armatimonadetes bacterium]|nr:peptidase family protein [Armatimonadota bacterium]